MNVSAEPSIRRTHLAVELSLYSGFNLTTGSLADLGHVVLTGPLRDAKYGSVFTWAFPRDLLHSTPLFW